MKDKDKDETPETPERPSLLALAKKMDAAVKDADEKRAAVDTAQAALDAARRDYGESVAAVTTLHDQWETLMKDIMSFGGTVHAS